VWLTAWGFYRDVGRDKIDSAFGLSQLILIVITYASINLTNTYINLTGPVAVGLLFFTLARLYAMATSNALKQNMVRVTLASQGALQVTLLLIRLDSERNVIRPAILEKIRYSLEHAGQVSKSVEMLTGDQKGLWGLFENTLAISWVAEAQDTAAHSAIEHDIEAVLAALSFSLQRHLVQQDNAASHFIYSRHMDGGADAPAGWRLIFAEALLAWDKRDRDQSN